MTKNTLNIQFCKHKFQNTFQMYDKKNFSLIAHKSTARGGGGRTTKIKIKVLIITHMYNSCNVANTQERKKYHQIQTKHLYNIRY